MAEGGFDDFQMENMGEKYPEFSEYNGETLEDINCVEDLDTLINTYQEESNSSKDKYNNKKPQKSHRSKYEELDSRIRYAKWLKEKRSEESTFTSNKDGKTVTITNKKSRVQFKTPGVEFVRVSNN